MRIWSTKPMTRGAWLTLAGLVITVLFIASILIPSRHHGEPAWRIKCSSNLRQIGLGAKMYAIANGGLYPPTVGTILATQEISADVFVCPISENRSRVTIATVSTRFPTTQAAQAALGDMIDDPAGYDCSYLWAGDGLNDATADADDVLAFDLPTEHGNAGMNVLFADGHVDWENCAQHDPRFPEFDRFYADFVAGKRPLRWTAPPPTTRP